jgi:hypothetical protein
LKRRHKVPIIVNTKSKIDIERYLETVKDYCSDEFAKGTTERDVMRRLRRTGTIRAARPVVRSQYLTFLGFGPERQLVLKIFLWILAFTGGYVALGIARSRFPGLTNRQWVIAILTVVGLRLALGWVFNSSISQLGQRRLGPRDRLAD